MRGINLAQAVMTRVDDARRHAHHMFRQLHVLDYFDFWMKIGDGVRWAGNFPGDITHHLAAKHRIFFHTGQALSP